jgi:ribonuclease Z
MRWEKEGAFLLFLADAFERLGVVYEKDGVRVIAFTVDHGAAIKPAVGYRIEYNGRSAVISGDTRYNDNVIKFGTGADLLIHEVCIAPSELLGNPFVQRVIAHHTTPREAGQVFAIAKPKMAAYTHVVLIGSDRVPPPTVENIIAETRQTYGGALEVGEDLMSFEIGEIVTVRRHNP